MEKDRRLELIDLAIQKHIKDNHHNLKDHETQYQLALSHLLSVSQLETSKIDETTNQSEASVFEEKENETVDGEGCRGTENDEIIKEVKKVKKQNFVTNCLLSAMIVLTVAWQLSQVSLVLQVKDGINHPFRSFGNMIKGMVKANINNGQDSDDTENNESTSLPSIKIPDMTHIDVPSLGKE